MASAGKGLVRRPSALHSSTSSVTSGATSTSEMRGESADEDSLAAVEWR
jgi:hypothetical protein